MDPIIGYITAEKIVDIVLESQIVITDSQKGLYTIGENLASEKEVQ